jgi:site-specific DNA recombinase
LSAVTKAACSDQPVANGVADLQERIVKTERRLTEILQELERLDSHTVDENDLRTVLARFGPVWELLNSREQVRIIRTLIDGVVYNGKTNKVTMTFRSAGIRKMCRRTGGEGRNES